MAISRRDALKLGALGGAAVALPLERLLTPAAFADQIADSALPRPFTLPFRRPPVLRPVRRDQTTDYFQMTMRASTATVVPGLTTPVFGYEGIVPGPTIRARQGRRTVVRFVNDLPRTHPQWAYTPWTSVHLHGSGSAPDMDGYASDICNPGQYKDYSYPNWQPARTLWYHDHGLHHTAENVYSGLAGMYLLTDAREDSLPLPRGSYDVPLVVADRLFNADGSLLFAIADDKGLFGNVVTVNGVPWPRMSVRRRKYRFRILNASISRSYEWYLDSGEPLTVVATDGGLVPRPITVPGFRHGPAERYDVVIDFARYPVGTRVVLRSRERRNNPVFTHTDKVMQFRVVDGTVDQTGNEVPEELFPDQPAMAVTEAEAIRTRRFDLVRVNGLWKINGQTWDDVVASGFRQVLADPYRDDVEIWEIRNDSGGWNHPVHVHFVDFKVLDRNGSPPMPHEAGPKDVVYVGENETVRLLIKFDRGRGKYMIHCHNLYHEDHDMMGQFEIRDDVTPATDPLGSPGAWLPAPPL